MTEPAPGATTRTARRYAGQSRDERDAERRRRLLDAGLELFGSLGFAGTPVERLCTEAKVSTRHFYLLYANKEAAFLDLYDEINQHSLDRALAAMDRTEGETIQVRLPQAFMAYLAPTLEDPRTARIVFLEVVGLSPRIEERRLEHLDSLIAIVVAEGSAAVERGEVTARDFGFAALALAGAANAIIYHWASAGGQGDVSELEHGLTELALTLLVR